MSDLKKNYSLVDIVKLFFAVGIVLIHSGVFNDNSNLFIWIIEHALFKIGVPFFFVASGFFLESKLAREVDKKDTIRKYFKRLLIPFVVWLLLNYYFVATSWNCQNILSLILTTIRNLVFYPWGSMWYILALIVAIAIIIPFYKKGKLKKIVIVGAFLYIFALLCNNYYFLLDNTPIQPHINKLLNIVVSLRNGIFEGLYFVSIGMYTSILLREKKINFKLNNIIFFVSYVLFIIEIVLIHGLNYKDDHSLFIMLYTLIPSLFIFLLQFNVDIKSKIYRNYSTGIYFSHRFVMNSVCFIVSLINTVLTELELFIIVIIIDVILLTILYRWNNKYVNSIIK